MSQVVVKTQRAVKRKSTEGFNPSSKKRRMQKYKIRSISHGAHQFIRTASTSSGNIFGLNTNTSTGFTFNGTSTGVFNMQLAFTLSGVQVYFGGTLATTLTLPNYTELTSLYDQYRIDWVECEFYFSNNNSSVNSPQTTLPILYICKDYDDANQAFVSDIQQYSTQETWQLGNNQGKDGKRTIRVKPNVDVVVFKDVATSGYARGKPMYIDTGSPVVPHYGIKVAYDPIQYAATSTTVGYLGLVCRYHLSMKMSK